MVQTDDSDSSNSGNSPCVQVIREEKSLDSIVSPVKEMNHVVKDRAYFKR